MQQEATERGVVVVSPDVVVCNQLEVDLVSLLQLQKSRIASIISPVIHCLLVRAQHNNVAVLHQVHVRRM